MEKLIRVTTVSMSLHNLLRGQLKYMDKYFDVVAVSSDDGFLDSVSNNESIRVKEIKMTRQITVVSDIKALWEMLLFFLREKPLIVHTHTPKAGIVGMMSSWLARVPIRLHTVAGLPLMETSGKKRRLLRVVEKFTYEFATKVYPNSFGLRDFIIAERLCNPNKLKVIGNGSSNGIDTGFFDPQLFPDEKKEELRKSLEITKENFVFVFVGRLVKDKGINELVNSFYKLAMNNCKLLLVGPYEKDLDPLLTEVIDEIESNPNIISVGYVNDVRPYYAISDVLVFPSYREGFPNVVMQAGAMGLPAIVTDINGCNEIVNEGENGLIIPPKDEKALFIAMRWFVENPKEVVRMAKSSRDLIVSRYEQKHVWEALLKEYQRMETEILTP